MTGGSLTNGGLEWITVPLASVLGLVVSEALWALYLVIVVVTAPTAAPTAAVGLGLWQALVVQSVILEAFRLLLGDTKTPTDWVLDKGRSAHVVALKQRHASADSVIKSLEPAAPIVWHWDQNVWQEALRDLRPERVDRLLHNLLP